MTRVVTRVVTLMTSHPESLTRSVTHTTLVQFNTKLHHRYHCPWFISSCLSLSTEKSHSRSYFLPFEFRVLSIEDSVTIFIPSHTLFLWTILWILSYRNNDLLISYHIFWSYLLILSLDLISWSYLIWQMILSNRWSYVSLTFLQHMLDAYFGYYLHALDMCYTQLTHAIHFRCCTSHACSMLYLWLTHVCLTAYMLTLLYKPSIDDCTL